MGVLEHVIELIKAACDNDFAEVNWIGKGGRGSPRENRDLNRLHKKLITILIHETLGTLRCRVKINVTCSIFYETKSD